jgi:hypothetical protein
MNWIRLCKSSISEFNWLSLDIIIIIIIIIIIMVQQPFVVPWPPFSVFLFFTQFLGLLERGSAFRKVAIYTEQHKTG